MLIPLIPIVIPVKTQLSTKLLIDKGGPRAPSPHHSSEKIQNLFTPKVLRDDILSHSNR